MVLGLPISDPDLKEDVRGLDTLEIDVPFPHDYCLHSRCLSTDLKLLLSSDIDRGPLRALPAD